MVKRSRKKKPQRLPILSDDLIVEILSRVPYRSLCRFKCVSRSWLVLCSDPDLRKKSPQTLSGFFCYTRSEDGDNRGLSFLNLSGKGRPLVDSSPPSPFPLSSEGGCAGHLFVQCSSSLLLWKFWRSRTSDVEYVVSNPATQKWILLPPTEVTPPNPWHVVRLGFDPSVSSCFYVFMFVMGLEGISGLEIYSSQTGGWVFKPKPSEWSDSTSVELETESVFLGGTLYTTTPDLLSVITVDTEGKIWRKIRLPQSYIQHEIIQGEVFIAQSQGRFYTMYIDSFENNRLSVWVLENEQWILKHTASISELFGRKHRSRYEFYTLVAYHSEHNMIFFTGGGGLYYDYHYGEIPKSYHDGHKLFSYDMDNGQVHAICPMQEYLLAPCFPYIPCFAEWSADGH